MRKILLGILILSACRGQKQVKLSHDELMTVKYNKLKVEDIYRQANEAISPYLKENSDIAIRRCSEAGLKIDNCSIDDSGLVSKKVEAKK